MHPPSPSAKRPSSPARSLHPRSRQDRRARSTRRASRCTRARTVRVDVVVRTRKIGHFFPGGTVDAFDVWLEFAGAGRRRPHRLLERPRRRRRPRPGRAGRALLSLLPDRRRRQPDQQAQCLAGAQRSLCPPDPARRGRRGALPRAAFRAMPKGPITFTREAELPQVLALLHAVRLRRAAETGTGSRAVCTRSNSREYSFDAATFPRTSPARSRTAFPTCRSSRWPKPKLTLPSGESQVDARRPQAGSRALERLGHRPAAAGRSERRRIRLPQSHRSRTRVRRWLAECRARADSGRRDRRRQAVHREGARHQSGTGPHLVFQWR